MSPELEADALPALSWRGVPDLPRIFARLRPAPDAKDSAGLAGLLQQPGAAGGLRTNPWRPPGRRSATAYGERFRGVVFFRAGSFRPQSSRGVADGRLPLLQRMRLSAMEHVEKSPDLD